MHGQRLALKTNLRALASPAYVEGAQEAMYGPDAGIDIEGESTNQIGGDLVFHGGGPVYAGDTSVVIGKTTSDGVLVQPQDNPDLHCRGVITGNSNVQALWLFSSNACGIYGFDGIRIEHAGRSDPRGIIVLAADNGRIEIYSRSGLLLRVQGS